MTHHGIQEKRHDRGVRLCLTYAYPPNSLSLCGPVNRKTDVAGYRTQGPATETDAGTDELLSRFKTMYPYLVHIASHNGIRDPFDPDVVDAYWIGNPLLDRILPVQTARFLTDTLGLNRTLDRKRYRTLMEGTAVSGIPHHAYHVCAVWRRTGRDDIPHTVDSMDACIVNYGIVRSVENTAVTVTTRRIESRGGLLAFSSPILRRLAAVSGEPIRVGDTVSYHWGVVCAKLSPVQRENLRRYTSLSVAAVNGQRTTP